MLDGSVFIKDFPRVKLANLMVRLIIGTDASQINFFKCCEQFRSDTVDVIILVAPLIFPDKGEWEVSFLFAIHTSRKTKELLHSSAKIHSAASINGRMSTICIGEKLAAGFATKFHHSLQHLHGRGVIGKFDLKNILLPVFF